MLISQCAVYDEYKTFLKFFTGLELKEVKNKQIYARGFHSIAEVKKVTTEHRNSLAVQWLRLGAFNAAGPGSIPGWGANIPQASWCGQKKPKQNKKKNPTEQLC